MGKMWEQIRGAIQNAIKSLLGDAEAALSARLPALTATLDALLRFCVIALAPVVLIRCIRSLFADRKDREQWGVLTLPNGARYELTHWENIIGRMRHADVRLHFASVSRSHATLQRQDDGRWLLFPLQETLLNGEVAPPAAELVFGDVLTLGGIDLHFFPFSEEEIEERRSIRKRGGTTVNGRVTLKWLTAMQAMLLAQFFLSSSAEELLQIIPAWGLLIGGTWGLYALYRVFRRTAFELETLAFLLSTVGMGVTAAYAPSSLLKQCLALFLGLILFLLLSLAMRNIRIADRCRVPIAVAATALLAFNVLTGERVFGAKNWISVGGFSFQPSELVKVAFVFVGAATLERLFSRKNLLFTAAFSCFCVGALGLMSDFGTALIFFAAFLVIAFLRSGDLPSVVLLVLAAAAGAYVIVRFKPYIARRFSAWRHVWENADAGGYQQTRTMSAIASGGLFGKGQDAARLKVLGAANTDLVFGVVSEEYGLLLALLCVLALAVVALFSFHSMSRARSTFYGIASATAASMLIFQTCLNIFGATDLLPLTGVTLPFVSMGGSSLMSCWALLAFIKAADARRDAGFTLHRLRFRRAAEEYTEPEPPRSEEEQSRIDDFFVDFGADDLFFDYDRDAEDGEGGDDE